VAPCRPLPFFADQREIFSISRVGQGDLNEDNRFSKKNFVLIRGAKTKRIFFADWLNVSGHVNGAEYVSLH